MVVFTGKPYLIDMIYMKLSGDKDIESIPFCEVFENVRNVKYDRDRTLAVSQEKGAYHICYTGDDNTANGRSFEIPAQQFAILLETAIYGKKQKILSLAIQPAGELLVNEVQQLLET